MTTLDDSERCVPSSFDRLVDTEEAIFTSRFQFLFLASNDGLTESWFEKFVQTSSLQPWRWDDSGRISGLAQRHPAKVIASQMSHEKIQTLGDIFSEIDTNQDPWRAKTKHGGKRTWNLSTAKQRILVQFV